MKKSYFLILGLILVLAVGCGIKSQLKKLPIVSGYSAKAVCSYTFIAERPYDAIKSEDLAMTPLNLATNKIDFEKKSVTSTVFGFGKKTAVYRNDLGCVLLYGKDDFNVQLSKIDRSKEQRPYPYGDSTTNVKPQNVDYRLLDMAVENMFDPSGNMDSIKTRAILVIHKDTIIAEKYANGINKDTELLGWSMTKSIMNTWVGMLVKDGKIGLTDKYLFDSWIDDRKEITLDNLMHMNTGLDWAEVYDKVSGATTMLFDSENVVDIASAPTLAHNPGKHWYYSSGTTNLISGYLRKQYKDHQDYLKFPYDSIFSRLDMDDTYLESDESGNYIGSSYCYATARDWGRFGLFYLRDGVWDGERLLPEGWVNYTQEEVLTSDGIYGAQFWLNKRGSAYPDAPHDLFSANGFQGQRIFIIPSKDLVIVRLGLNENLEFNDFLRDVTNSIR